MANLRPLTESGRDLLARMQDYEDSISKKSSNSGVSIDSGLLDRMKAFEAQTRADREKKEKEDAAKNRVSSYIEKVNDLSSRYERAAESDGKELLDLHRESEDLLTDMQRYGDADQNLMERVKSISDGSYSVLRKNVEAVKSEQNRLPTFDAESFADSMKTPSAQKKNNVPNPSSRISPTMRAMDEISPKVERAEIPNAYEKRSSLMEAQAQFNRDMAKKKEESKVIPSIPAKNKSENVTSVSETAEQESASLGENILGGIQTAGQNVALGAANAIDSIVNGLEQAIGDAASGGAYSKGFQKLNAYFGSMPSDLRTDVLMKIGTEGIPERGSLILQISRKTGVPENVVVQYAGSAKIENMREALLDSGFASGMDKNVRDKVADISFTIGQQIPGMMLSGTLSGVGSAASGVGKALGANPATVMIGLSVAGNEVFQAAKENGYEPSLYVESLLQGGVEMMLEGMIGVSDLASYRKILANTGSSVGNVVKSFANYLVSAGQEGAEEVLNVPLSNAVKAMFGDDIEIGFGEGQMFDWQEMVKNGVDGATVGLIMGGVMGVSMAVAGAYEGAELRDRAESLNAISSKLPEHYRPAQTIQASKATEEQITDYGKQVIESLEQYKEDAESGRAVLSAVDIFGEEVSEMVEDNSTVQIQHQADILAHMEAGDTNGALAFIDEEIQHYNAMADALREDNALQEKGGNAAESAVKVNRSRLGEMRTVIENGTYDTEKAQQVIADSLRTSLDTARKERAASSSFAQKVVASLGSVQAADSSLAHTVSLLEEDTKNSVAGAAKKLRYARNALAAVRSDVSADVRSMMGASEKQVSRALSSGGRAVNVKLDYSMGVGENAKYSASSGEISINPYAIAQAQRQMEAMGESMRSNMARVKLVHEAGHAAAKAESSFVPQVYAIYTEMQESGLLPGDAVNEAQILEAYRKAGVLQAFLETQSGRAQVDSLVKNGMSRVAATDAAVQAYMQEEYVMHFLEYVEKNGGRLYESIAPEQRNVFVRAIQRIAEIFRSIAAKIRGTDKNAAQEMDGMAGRLMTAVRAFAGVDAVAAQESAEATQSADDARGNSDNGAGASGESEATTGTPGDDVRFSLKKPVEETKNLIAVHNLNSEKLLKSLNLGGMPMPSIAIVRAKDGFEEFGDISLIFSKDTIDPELMRSNKIYSGDAWTPTYPHVEYKVNENVRKRIEKKINSLVPHEIMSDLGRVSLDSSNIEDVVNRYNGDMVEAYRNDSAMKYAYLRDMGKDITLPTKEKSISRYNERENGAIIHVAEVIGAEELDRIRNAGYEEMQAAEPKIRAAVAEYVQRQYADDPALREIMMPSEPLAYNELSGYVYDAMNYLTNGLRQEVDYMAAREIINAQTDQTSYEAWLGEQFNGIVEKEGIRNNVDYFTPSGNRRSFEATHWENTLENVVRTMKETGEKGIGNFGGGNIFGASTKEFASIADVKKSTDRLQNIPAEEYEKMKDEFRDRFFALASSLPENKGSFSAADSAANMLIEAVAKYKTKNGMANYLRRESQGWANYSPYVVDELIALVNDIRAMPTQYFEAKPQRAVGFDEVVAAVIPDTSSNELREKLFDAGVRAEEYAAGDETSRLEIMNRIADEDDVRFSLSTDSAGRKLTAQQQEFFKDSAVRDENGNLKVMYHGTNESFTIFDRKKARSSGTYGNGFYFSDSNSHAATYGTLHAVYLNITKPIQNGDHKITKDQLRKFVQEIADNEDYGIEHYGYGATVDRVVDSVYGKDDFAMLLDINITAVGNMVEAVELFNKVNGTNYDGIIAQTETVAFYPEQVKSVDNLNPTDDPDIRFSLITAETSDRERARILRGKTISDLAAAQELSEDAAQAGGISVWEDIDSRFGKEKLTIIKKLVSEFGVFKEYENTDIDLLFEFSVNNFRESYSKQGRSYKRFAKMFSVFDSVVDKAVGIEVHLRDDYKPDPTLRNVYVLMSAFEDGDEIVPVKLEVKEFRDKENKLYVAVSLEGIKKTEVWKQGNTGNGVTQDSRSVSISIPDLMRNVKASDTNFTKYFPSEFLTEEQKAALDKLGDVRYSVVSAKDAARIARLEEDKAFLKKQMQKGRKMAMSPDVLDSMERELRRSWMVSREDTYILRQMFGVADAMYNGKMDYDAGMARLTASAREVLENVYAVDDSLLRENEAFIKYIKSLSLSVPADNESDLSGGYGEYRRENAKFVKLSRNGTPIDTVYEEICDMFPGMLDREIANPADQIEEIVSVMRSMQEEEVPVFTDTLNEAAETLVSDVLAKYDRGARETYSYIRDKQQQKAIDRAANAYEARISRIEMNAARDAEEYSRIIERYRNVEEARDMAGDRREYSRRIRMDARAIRSAAVSPNRKKFVPEEYRKAAEHAAQWLDAVSRSGRGIPTNVTSFVRGSFDKLSGLYGEDFAGLSRMLLDEMDSFVSEKSQSGNEELRSAYAYRAAYKLGRLLRKSIADQNRVVLDGKRRDAAAAGGEIVSHLDSRRHAEKEYNTINVGKGGKIKGNTGGVVRGAYRKIALSTMDGYSFLRRMGHVGTLIYDTLREAQSAQVMRAKEYVDSLERELLYDKKNKADGVKLSDYIGDKQKMVTVTLENGQPYTMTAAQAMNIVTLYERAAGKSHIENGGVRLVNPKDRTLTRATVLTAADVAAIREQLDAQDLRVMDVMNRFIRENCTEWGNAATLERYGFYRFTTQDYFPITVDRNALPANMTKEQAMAALQFNVENVGFAKAAEADAKAPVIIDSFIDVINRHVEGMASYSAYLNAEDSVNRIMSAPGVRDAMQRALGRDSIRYMEEMMTALKGGGRTTSITDSLADWWLRNSGAYKSAAVSYNLSTAAKQPLSYVRAAAVMDPKYLIQGMHGIRRGREAHEEMMQYSGIGVKKDMGYSEVGVSRSVGAQIGYEKGGAGKAIRDFNEFGMSGAAKMDKITWDSLWIACRKEVMDKNPGISTDKEEWMKATAKRFAEVVAQTQVVDSPLDSSPISRSRNPVVRNIFAFSSEPIKGFNLMMNALDDAINTKQGTEAHKKAAGNLTSAVSVTVIGWALEALVSSAFRALRDDDDDFLGVTGQEFAGNMLSNAVGAIPYVSQAYDLFYDAFMGYDYTDMGTSVITDAIQSALDLANTLENPQSKKETVLKQLRDMVEAVATLTGVPLRNINRTIINAGKAYFHLTDNYVWEYELQSLFYNPKNATAREKHEFNSLLTDAYLSGNKEAFEYIYNDMRKLGLSPQTILNGIAKDAYAKDISGNGTTLTRYTPGSEAWYIGMKGIFARDLTDADGLEKELTRLYKATEDNTILPKYKSDSYTVDGETYKMTVQQHEQVLDEYAEIYYEIGTVLRNSTEYKNADDPTKAYWMAQAQKYAGAVSIYRVDDSYNLRVKWIEKMRDKSYYDVAGYIIKNLKPSDKDE